MTHCIFTLPASQSAGVTSCTMGVIRMLDSLGVRVGYFKPVEQFLDNDKSKDASVELAKRVNDELQPPACISGEIAKKYIGEGQSELLLENIIALYEEVAELYEVVVVEGLNTKNAMPFAAKLNADIAKALDADIIFICSMNNLNYQQLSEKIELTTRNYGGIANHKIQGVIINRADEYVSTEGLLNSCNILNHLELLGLVKSNPEMSSPRTFDIINCIEAKVLFAGEIKERRVTEVIPCIAGTAKIASKLHNGSLMLCCGDSDAMMLLASIAELTGIPIAGIVLSDGYMPNQTIIHFIEKAIRKGLPVLKTKLSLPKVAEILENRQNEIPVDDQIRIQATVEYISENLNQQWFVQHCGSTRTRRLSPAAFRFNLVKSAIKANKTIVLPEGEEPRTIEAASIVAQKNIAKCVLLGDENKILEIAKNSGFDLGKNITICAPNQIKEKYIPKLMEIRKGKDLTYEQAKDYLEDPVAVGTMMVVAGDVDGLVAGAINTTANTIRPALQLIKTKPDSDIVSSLFFMCLPEQVVVYADCAVNPNPNAQQLADIAIQSAQSAMQFGIEPKVAMISYSTGDSGSGSDVEKVSEATKIAKQKRPDLLIDGPLQYDAAAIESVGRKKAPDSLVAGRATVFIFPDLNTGNTTYKAVQRSANVVSMGPMLQGLNKPVNDLSRGALVDDIVYTIALTCIQADDSII